MITIPGACLSLAEQVLVDAYPCNGCVNYNYNCNLDRYTLSTSGFHSNLIKFLGIFFCRPVGPSQSFDEGVFETRQQPKPEHVPKSCVKQHFCQTILCQLGANLCQEGKGCPKRRKGEKGRPITRLLGLYV